MSKIVDAVTAVLVQDQHVFIAERALHLPAFPGFHAFPGGKVDKTESEEPFAHAVFAAHPPRLMRAMVRELVEEIGFDLEAAAARGDVLRIDALGIALTPPQAPVRFNTHFFRVMLKTRPSVQLDPGETASYEWASAAELMQRYEHGGLMLAPPTFATLSALADDLQAARIPGLHFEDRNEELPMTEVLRGVRMIFVRS
ncbi:MAG TPA: NUDIX hydrolase, partial [Nevskiaceae bacterium]|nr:NUDIX hydrolase [Nevskiaceae bacterium]